MEYKTTQGGESTLVFDDDEQDIIRRTAKQFGVESQRITDTIGRLRQANPLATFSQLLNTVPSVLSADTAKRTRGVASTATPRRDPLADLEADIRREIGLFPRGASGTSNMVQAKATLFQALATCLQTRALCQVLEEKLIRGDANG